jgi:hypothetical protein
VYNGRKGGSKMSAERKLNEVSLVCDPLERERLYALADTIVFSLSKKRKVNKAKKAYSTNSKPKKKRKRKEDWQEAKLPFSL